MNINELTDPSHTTIIEKIADLLHLVSSETELAYHPVTGNVIFIDVLEQILMKKMMTKKN